MSLGLLRICRRRAMSAFHEKAELEALAKWWADEMVGNEVAVADMPKLSVFRRLVAEEMVRNDRLGWPFVESALVDLDELYPGWVR
jgi:hypothetical protein